MPSETMFESMTREMKTYQQELTMKTAKEHFDAKITQLADLALEYGRERGEQDPVTQLLVAFLDVAMEMKDLMKTAESVTVAMQCVEEAISFLDETNTMSNQMLESTVRQKYTFWARMKQRRLHRRAMRNHRNRMKAFAEGLQAKYDMAQEMVKSMKRFATDLQKSFNKKKRGKKGAAPAAGMSPRVANFLQERAQQQNVSVDVSKYNGTAEGGAPNAGAAGGSGDYQDIFHG